MSKVIIAGIGMGNRDTLTIGALNAIKGCDCLIGAQRLLESFGDIDLPKKSLIQSSDISEFIRSNEQYEVFGVLMSGDIGFYSGTKKLLTLLEGLEVHTYCGITSVQYLCSRLGLPWEDVQLVSAHGKEQSFLPYILGAARTMFLMDHKNTPSALCNELCRAGLGSVKVTVGSRLSYRDETIVTATAKELLNKDFDPLSVVLAENDRTFRPQYATHGIEDSEFIRGDVPMTKMEVRSVSLSKLKLKQDDVIYDIGAGTGSVSIEMALQARMGHVFAIEKEEDACSLIQANKEKFGVYNLTVVRGFAPHALEGLHAPDAVFIGGSGGQMGAIVDYVLSLNPKVRIVINAIAIESITEAVTVLEDRGLATDLVTISAARAKKAGGYHMMTGLNPVAIISGQRGGSL